MFTQNQMTALNSLRAQIYFHLAIVLISIGTYLPLSVVGVKHALKQLTFVL